MSSLLVFFGWVAGLIDKFIGYVGGQARREDKAFSQSTQMNDRLWARVANLESQGDSLVKQNIEQAKQMSILQRQVDECQEHHEECERDRNLMAAEMDKLKSKVTTIETQILPGTK